MGRPKLLLPWGKSTVIETLLEVIDQPEITASVVIVRADDSLLAARVSQSKAIAFCPPIAPIDMRESVSLGLKELERRFHPTPDDGWMLIPADHPCLSKSFLESLIARWQTSQAMILIPRNRERRGHPAFFRWSLASLVHELPMGFGLNRLISNHAPQVVEHLVEDDGAFADLDTPEDYDRLMPRHLTKG